MIYVIIFGFSGVMVSLGAASLILWALLKLWYSVFHKRIIST